MSADKKYERRMWTTGPWILNDDTGFPEIWTIEGRQLAQIYGETKQARTANAHLMVAAPKLYEALFAILNDLKKHASEPMCELWAKGCAVLTEARGEQ
jgi:hypothetical protein